MRRLGENKLVLEQAKFTFTQESSCLSPKEEMETLEIELTGSLGVDRIKGDHFFIIKTECWSVDNFEELKALFNKIEKIL